MSAQNDQRSADPSNGLQQKVSENPLLWECYDALTIFVTTYNGRPSRFRQAEERTGETLHKLHDKLDAFFFPEESK